MRRPTSWLRAALLAASAVPAIGAEAPVSETPVTPIASWLALGPRGAAPPVFADEAGGKFGVAELLAQDVIPRGAPRPVEGDAFGWARAAAGALIVLPR